MISELLQKIMNARLGRDVRQSIHDAISQCYDDATGNPESIAHAVAEIENYKNEINVNLETFEKSVNGNIGAMLSKPDYGSMETIHTYTNITGTSEKEFTVEKDGFISVDPVAVAVKNKDGRKSSIDVYINNLMRYEVYTARVIDSAAGFTGVDSNRMESLIPVSKGDKVKIIITISACSISEVAVKYVSPVKSVPEESFDDFVEEKKQEFTEFAAEKTADFDQHSGQIRADVNEIKEANSRLSESITEITDAIGYDEDITTSANIFNKSKWINGGYYNDNGSYVEDTRYGYGYVEYIPVDGASNYYFSNPFFINEFDENKLFVKGGHNNNSGARYTTMANTRYITVSVTETVLNTFMVAKDQLPSEYIPYSEFKTISTDIDSLRGGCVKKPKIYCVGDSLTAGCIDSSVNPYNIATKNYPYWVKEVMKADVYNAGRPGATPQTWFNNYKSIFAQPSKTTDICLIMLGTNGGISDTLATDVEPYSDYNDYADTSCGSFCKIIEWLMEVTENHAEIVLMTPPMNWMSGRPDKYNTVANSVPVIKKIGERYALPVIDNFYECGINKLNGDVFRPNDGLHLSAKGYHKLGTFVANKLKSIVSTFSLDDDESDIHGWSV